MGNLQRQCRGKTNNLIELDCRKAVYFPNETISGTVLLNKPWHASIELTGIVYFQKRKRTHLEKRQIKFFSAEYLLNSSVKTAQYFQLYLDDHFPPSFNDAHTYPSIFYTINLIYRRSSRYIHCSIPIRVCPHVHVDRPLLLRPLVFGPVENRLSAVQIEIKLNRSIFTYNDTIQIHYEVHNPHQRFIHSIHSSLGIYYVIESNVWQEDLFTGDDHEQHTMSNNQLFRNNVSIDIPHKLDLPPTYKFKYGKENDSSSFNLSIDYKVQIKIYLDTMDNLWQIDVPVVLCNDHIEQLQALEKENNEHINGSVVEPPNVNKNDNIVLE